MKWKLSAVVLFCAAVVVLGLFAFGHSSLLASIQDSTDIDALLGNDEDTPPPTQVSASSQDVALQPKDISALGGYNVLIADRGNDRIIEVTPDKRIVWEYDFKGLPPGYGADDAFFTDGGKTIIVNLEKYHVIEEIDYRTKKIIWQYGRPGTHGSGPGLLYSPDDAYKLQNGDVIVADIRNCRVVEISPEKKIVHQYGRVRQCKGARGFLDGPNGDTPLPDGHILISTILDHSVTELDNQWKQVFSIKLPLKYPSDPQMTQAGNILIAEYQNPGKILEISRQGQIVWEYDGENGIMLNKPSLAIELPNGNILSNDDLNHRVIVIDKETKKIIWQYGVTGKPGDRDVQLNIPDGVDIIKHAPINHTSPVHTVGQITRHATQYVGKQVLVKGYMRKNETGYVLFSDEATGSISNFDLPITGQGIDLLRTNQSYLVEGMFLESGLASSNGNPDHLELSAAPEATQ